MNITVVGAGYVGLITAACFAELGNDVTCIDLNPDRVNALNSGKPPFFEPGLADLVARNTQNGRLRASFKIEEAVLGSQMIFIAVGTPSVNGDIDLSQVLGVAEQIGATLRDNIAGHIVVVKSTVVPGTTDGPVRDTLAAAAGVDRGQVRVAMNPEFLRQGAAVDDFMQPDRIVVGASSAEIASQVVALYEKLDCASRILTTAVNAELIKYATNTFLATAISFSNEFANICEQTPGADVTTVMQGLHYDRRLSSWDGSKSSFSGIVTYLKAGCGYGGSCLPKDVRAFTRYAEKKQVPSELLSAAMYINEGRSKWLVDRVCARIGDLAGRSILVVGIAFKPGTDDLRDSPALGVLDALTAAGAKVLAWDPFVSERQLSAWTLDKIEDVKAAIAQCDAMIITGNFEELAVLDWCDLLGRSPCRSIVDGRGVLTGISLPASVNYDVVGRQQTAVRE